MEKPNKSDYSDEYEYANELTSYCHYICNKLSHINLPAIPVLIPDLDLFIEIKHLKSGDVQVIRHDDRYLKDLENTTLLLDGILYGKVKVPDRFLIKDNVG